MKTSQYILTILTCVSTIMGYSTFSQEAADPPALPELPAPAAIGKAWPGLPPAPLAPVQFAQSARATQEAIAIAPDAPQSAGFAATWVDNDHLAVHLLGGTPRPRTLVVRTSETDQKALSALEEDLNVMSRILTKAVNEKGTDEDTATAMGMKIQTLTGGGGATVQNLYLDGYGALFLLHARFPLLPPPEPAKEETRKESTDSTWEEARHELYGPKETGPGFRGLLHKESAREAYDSKKVSKLKEALVDALKNGTNIRNLKPEEFITVVVMGSENAPVARSFGRIESRGDANQSLAIRESGRADRTFVTALARSAGGETVMTLRAKKADVDAFAKGDLKREEFQKKVSIVTY